LTFIKKLLALVCAAVLFVSCSEALKGAKQPDNQNAKKADLLKIIVWNIQNGMWSDQGNNYDNFVAWVKSYNPDVCIWCESRSNYQTGKKTAMLEDQVYLPDGWGELAQRYGHQYWSKGGHDIKDPCRTIHF
jgi:hypothetical protein